MAVRWLYDTKNDNYCIGMTVDDTIPDPNDPLSEEPDGPTGKWSQDDPTLTPPAIQDLVPPKIYDPTGNTIREATQGEIDAYELKKAKRALSQEIKKRTERLFNKGFTFNTQQFRLNLDDFVNYKQMSDDRQSLTYPITIATRNRNAFDISGQAQMRNFFEAAVARRDEIFYGAGKHEDLLIQIGSATNMTQLNAIVDNRT